MPPAVPQAPVVALRYDLGGDGGAEWPAPLAPAPPPRERRAPIAADPGSGVPCRFLLGRSGARPLLAIGLNPSTATPERSDATMLRLEGVAQRQGFDGFLMLNLCPLRSTDWRALPARLEPGLQEANLDRIVALVGQWPAVSLWAAWGNGILQRPYLVAAARALIQRLEPFGPRWQHFGPLTRAGHPRHPCRLSYGWRFAAFDAASYRRQLGD